MIRVVSFILVYFILNVAFSQFEEAVPMSGNPSLISNKLNSNFNLKVNVGTFDSTFIYGLDTIALPLFDDFSTDKFQKYEADFSDAGVTFDKVYHLLDSFNNVISNTTLYTEQVTYHRITDPATNTFVDNIFPPTEIKIADLSSYPVTYIPTIVYPNYFVNETIGDPVIDTTWVSAEIYQDSATQFFTTVNSPEAIWADSEVHRNNTRALLPRSIGVATFDGLDENGFPYSIGSSITNYADHLTSKTIDIGGLSVSDSVYLSFLYQAGGFGDAPEDGDSLVLEFFEQGTDSWNRVWSVNGTALDDFKMAHLLIDNPDYFNNGFKFRFRNYGGLSGDLDNFHIDYLNLRAVPVGGSQDTVIQDFAIVYPVGSLLDTYTSVPWDHYKNSANGRMSSNVEVVVRNNDDIPLNEQDGSTEIIYNGTVEGSHVLSESLLTSDVNYSPWSTYISFHDFSSGPRFDETKTGLTETFDVRTGVTTLSSDIHPENDSCFTQQTFQNYYSYDDGSAEKAYGPTAVQARLAIQYTPFESDSLIGARIHFVPTVNDLSDKLFLLTVWGDDNGVPGDVIYQDELFFPRQPTYDYDQDLFTNYMFADTQKVHVGGTFYIGWQQFDPERLNVGLDINTVNNDKTFYSIDGEISWIESTIAGSVMIHPIFSTAYDVVLGLEDNIKNEVLFNVYPNPSNDFINIEGPVDIEKVELINIQGQKFIDSNQSKIDLRNIPEGVYFLRINDSHGPYKIIIK